MLSFYGKQVDRVCPNVHGIFGKNQLVCAIDVEKADIGVDSKIWILFSLLSREKKTLFSQLASELYAEAKSKAEGSSVSINRLDGLLSEARKKMLDSLVALHAEGDV